MRYTLAESFALILTGLRATIAPNRSMTQERILFLDFVWRRLHRLANRFQILFTRWKNATLRKPRPPGPPRTRPAAPAPKFRIPRGRWWLIKDTQPAAGARSQLCHLLATDPDLPAFLEAAPQARRLLNPICHALGINLDAPHGVPIGLPPPPARPRRERKPRPPRPRREKTPKISMNYSPGPCRTFESL